jgi:hypothetical protein
MKTKYYLFFIAMLSLLLQSCVDLKSLNSAANTAEKSLGSYDDIKYTFTSSYLEYEVPLQIRQLREAEYKRNKIQIKETVIDQARVQTCTQADKAVKLFITPLQAYFANLAKLSSEDLINYNFDDIATAVKADPALKSQLHLDDDKIDAASKISAIVANDLMGAYRERKLRKAIIKYDPDISKALDGLDACMGALYTSVDNYTGIIETTYQPLLADSTIAIEYKFQVLEQYDQVKKELDLKKTSIAEYRKALAAIKDSHNKLAQQLKNSKLNKAASKEMIDKYAADIYDIWQIINSLNNSNK